MAEVRLFAEAFYSRRIASYDTDVMEHCGILHIVRIESQFGMLSAYVECLFSHLAAVDGEYLLELRLFIVMVYYLFV